MTQTPTFGTLARAIIRLAVPIMFARAGMLIMAFVATAFVGHAGADELAYFAIATAPQLMILTLGIGLMLGTGVLAAQAFGAGRLHECGMVWRIAMLVGVAYGGAAGVLLGFGEDLLLAAGQPPDLATGGGRVLEMYAVGMPVAILFVASSLFLEGIGRPRVGMSIVIVGNAVNLLACWALVEGHFGLPALGAAGGALGLSIARWFMVLAITGYVLVMPDARRFGVLGPLAGARPVAGRLLRIGAPMGVALGLESAAFAAVAGFAGLLGNLPVAAFQIATNLLAMVFMLSIGIGTATTVQVAQATGRGDPRSAMLAGWAGLVIVLVTTATAGAALHVFASSVAGAYTSDPRLLSLAVAAVGITAVMVIADGLQGVMISALRGIGDVMTTTLVYFFAFWIIGVPLAYVSGGHGLQGLLWSLFLALSIAGVALAWQFHRLTRRFAI